MYSKMKELTMLFVHISMKFSGVWENRTITEEEFKKLYLDSAESNEQRDKMRTVEFQVGDVFCLDSNGEEILLVVVPQT